MLNDIDFSIVNTEKSKEGWGSSSECRPELEDLKHCLRGTDFTRLNLTFVSYSEVLQKF